MAQEEHQRFVTANQGLVNNLNAAAGKLNNLCPRFISKFVALIVMKDVGRHGLHLRQHWDQTQTPGMMTTVNYYSYAVILVDPLSSYCCALVERRIKYCVRAVSSHIPVELHTKEAQTQPVEFNWWFSPAVNVSIKSCSHLGHTRVM